MALLLDTCVFVDLLHGRQTAIDATAAFPVRPCVCDVTMMELYVGARTQWEEARIEMLLGDFAPVSIDQRIYRRAGQWMRHYKASHGLDVPDAETRAALLRTRPPSICRCSHAGLPADAGAIRLPTSSAAPVAVR